MIRVVLFSVIALVLSACAGGTPKPDLIVEKPVVFMPDGRFFYYPTINQFPDPSTLTDEDIAELLIQLDTNNRTCKRSINALRAQLIAAKKRIEDDKSGTE